MIAKPIKTPQRGEIWFTHGPHEPLEKPPRPVVVVSVEERNRHPRAETVLVIPLTTSIQKAFPTHVLLHPGETGLPAISTAKAEDITVVRKESLILPRTPLRRISNARICELARKVVIAMDCTLP